MAVVSTPLTTPRPVSDRLAPVRRVLYGATTLVALLPSAIAVSIAAEEATPDRQADLARAWWTDVADAYLR